MLRRVCGYWGEVLVQLFVVVIFFLMIRRPPRSTQSRSSAASDVYKRQRHVCQYQHRVSFKQQRKPAVLSCPRCFYDLCPMFFAFHTRSPTVYIGWVKEAVPVPPYTLCFFIPLPVSHLSTFSAGQHNPISYIHIYMYFVIPALDAADIPWLFYSYRSAEQGCHPFYSCFHSSSP